jgi:membrane associated rhomboid family serine protease
MGAGPDLFVVCKNCGSQVSPYITECPYCGSRIRKRAPKIEREDKPQRKRRTPSMPSLGPLRTGEIPGVRGDELRRPVATITIVAIGCLWWLATIPLQDEGFQIVIDPLGEWWQVLTAPFVHVSGWYQFASLGAIGIFGWVLERKLGWLPVIAVWLITASGSVAVVKAIEGAPEGGSLVDIDGPVAIGSSYGAIGLLIAWALPVWLERRREGGDGEYDDADLLGAGVILALLVLMPAARYEVSVLATAAAVVLGALCGLVLSRVTPR